MTCIALPINPEIVGCLGHTNTPKVWCEHYINCAAHQTIPHDLPGTNRKIVNRKCETENMVGYLPMEGFPKRDEEEA